MNNTVVVLLEAVNGVNEIVLASVKNILEL